MNRISTLVLVGSMQREEECAANPWASEAMNTTQLELMRAIRHCGVDSVIGVSMPSASAWHSKIIQRGAHSTLETGIHIRQIPFLSLGPIQPLSQFLSCLYMLIRISFVARPDCILVATPQLHFSLASLILGYIHQIPTIIIAADVTTQAHPLNISRAVRRYLHQRIIKIAPGIIVFSNHAGREIRKFRPWIRMVRPPAKDLQRPLPPISDGNSFIVYFAGSTSSLSGTDLILQAISLIKDGNYQFWFSGRGPLDQAIKDAAVLDKRITHWGFVDREKYRELLQEASVLLNPRPTRIPENRYNFPSKLMEYLAAGRPIISTSSSDIDEYYEDALILLEDETPQGLAKVIRYTYELPYEVRAKLGNRARNYADQETWEAQAVKILDFAKTLQVGE